MQKRLLSAILALAGLTLAATVVVGRSGEGVTFGAAASNGSDAWIATSFMNTLQVGDGSIDNSKEDTAQRILVHLDSALTLKGALEFDTDDSNTVSVSDMLPDGDALWVTGYYTRKIVAGSLTGNEAGNIRSIFVLKTTLDLEPISLWSQVAPESSTVAGSKLRKDPAGNLWLTGSYLGRRPVVLGGDTLPAYRVTTAFVSRLSAAGEPDTTFPVFPVLYDSTLSSRNQGSSSITDLEFLPSGEALLSGSFSGYVIELLGQDTAKITSTPWFARYEAGFASRKWLLRPQRDTSTGSMSSIGYQFGADGTLWAGLSFRVNLILDSAAGLRFEGTRGVAIVSIDPDSGRFLSGWAMKSDKALTLSGLALVGDSLWAHGSFTSRDSADLGAGLVTSTDTSATDGWAAKVTDQGIVGHLFVTGSGTGVVSKVFDASGAPLFLGTNVDSAGFAGVSIPVSNTGLGSFWLASLLDAPEPDTTTALGRETSSPFLQYVQGGVRIDQARIGSIARWRSLDGRVVRSSVVPVSRELALPPAAGLLLLSVSTEDGATRIVRVTGVAR